jgi:LysR family glycine cleavage system transcriptional activator
MFRRLPSPTALRTFESAARLGSFKAAAEELRVTPTAVSHQIRALEERLGRSLFARSTRSIALTAAGREIATVLTRAFVTIRDVIDEVVSEKAVITISTTASFATLWLVPRLIDFYARYPDYRVQLETTTRTTNLMQERRIDLAIRYGRGPYEELDATPLFSEAIGAYVSPRLLPVDDLTLNKLPLIETAWQQEVLEEVNWTAWLSKADLSSNHWKIVSFGEEEHVLHAAIAGHGIALASSILAADFVRRDLLVPYRRDVTLVGAAYTVLCLPDQRNVEKIRSFLSWLTSAQSSPPRGSSADSSARDDFGARTLAKLPQ